MEGTGEDSSVASSMTQSSELFLTDSGNGTTEIRIKAKADVLGRLGSFGLSVMKTKADRMWEEFGANFSAVVVRSGEAGDRADAPVQASAQAAAGSAAGETPPLAAHSQPAFREVVTTAVQQPRPAKAKWWQRIASSAGSSSAEKSLPAGQRLATDIYVELHRSDGVIKVLWPASAAPDAAQWLKELL
jgi:hypothetical protein